MANARDTYNSSVQSALTMLNTTGATATPLLRLASATTRCNSRVWPQSKQRMRTVRSRPLNV